LVVAVPFKYHIKSRFLDVQGVPWRESTVSYQGDEIVAVAYINILVPLRPAIVSSCACYCMLLGSRSLPIRIGDI